MEFAHKFLVCVCFLIGAMSACCFSVSMAQSPARALDALLQGYAFRAFVRPRTGRVFDAAPPANLTGIAISAMRLRSGSLRRYGVGSYREFSIPPGVLVQPYVERVVLVYHNLGNWSKYYYPLPGYTYLAPVLGLLPYDAVNLSAVDLPELQIVASGSPISINFGNVAAVPDGLVAKCVWFDLDGAPQFRDLVSSNACSTIQRGHFSIVVNYTAAPAPAPSVIPPSPPTHHHKKSSSKVWKIAVGVVGGVLALILLTLLVMWCYRYRRNRRLQVMEQHADVGEALRMAPVGRTQAPVALGTRTQPVIETEYVA